MKPVEQHEYCFPPPMECLPVNDLPDGPRWIYELKLDGYRAQAIHRVFNERLARRIEILDSFSWLIDYPKKRIRGLSRFPEWESDSCCDENHILIAKDSLRLNHIEENLDSGEGSPDRSFTAMNPSFRETITLQGNLVASGIRATCTLRAVKISIPRLDVQEYVKVEIANAPQDLPDGKYELCFEARKFKVKRAEGVWFSGSD